LTTYPHIMLDLETGGARPGCVIRSIGAVAFDFDGRPLGPSYYANIDGESCVAAGLTYDPLTMAWWGEQPEAEAALADKQLPIRSALEFFAAYIQATGTEEVCVWSHGAGFDIPITEAAMWATGISIPWKFRNARDTRTMLWLAERRGITVAVDRQGLRHQALDDAKTMALRIMAIYQRLRE
jgi:hypothetical protein